MVTMTPQTTSARIFRREIDINNPFGSIKDYFVRHHQRIHWSNQNRPPGVNMISASTTYFHWPRAPCSRGGAAARFGAFAGKFTTLFGFIATTPCIATQLATDRGLVSSKQSGKLSDVVLGFHKAVSLISFNLAEVFVTHRATSTCRSGSLEC